MATHNPPSALQVGQKKADKIIAQPAVSAATAQRVLARQPSGRAVSRPGPNSAFMARAAAQNGRPINPMDLDSSPENISDATPNGLVVPYSETLKKQQLQAQQQRAERLARSPNGGMMPNGQQKIMGVDAIQAQQQQEANDAPRDAYMSYATNRLREQRQTAAEQGRQQTAAQASVAPPAAPAVESPEDTANRIVQPKGASAPAAVPVSKGPGPGNTGYPGDGIYAMGKGNAVMKNDYGTGFIEPAPVVRTPVAAPLAIATAPTAPPDDLMRRATALQNAARLLKTPTSVPPVVAPPKRLVALGPDSNLTPEQQKANQDFGDQQSAIFKANTPEGRKQAQGLSSVIGIPLPNPGGIAPPTVASAPLKKKKPGEDDGDDPANPDTDI